MQEKTLVGSKFNHLFFNLYSLTYEELWLKFQCMPLHTPQLLAISCTWSMDFHHHNAKILIYMQPRTLSLNYEGQKLHRTAV